MVLVSNESEGCKGCVDTAESAVMEISPAAL